MHSAIHEKNDLSVSKPIQVSPKSVLMWSGLSYWKCLKSAVPTRLWYRLGLHNIANCFWQLQSHTRERAEPVRDVPRWGAVWCGQKDPTTHILLRLITNIILGVVLGRIFPLSPIVAYYLDVFLVFFFVHSHGSLSQITTLLWHVHVGTLKPYWAFNFPWWHCVWIESL